MSLTAHRVIQYIVIITLCTLAGGGYWYWKDQQAKASVTEKSSDTTGLVGYWSFDEGSGTKAEDFSPTGSNTGTLTNSPTWVDGKVGKALSFDGVDDWVDSGSSTSLNISADYTISMWVYNSAGSDTFPTLFNRATQATNNGFFWVYTTGTNEADLSFQWADGTNFYSTGFNGALSLNTWQHVVFTFDNASKALKLYINGSQFSTTRTLTGSLPVDDGTLYIGTYNGTATTYSFQGSLDEVRVYSRALSGANVLDLYQKSVGSKVNTTENSELTNGLVGLWSFNGADVSGTTAYDRSGNGNNATMSGGPTIASGKIGQALHFNEGSEYVRAASGSAGLSQGSISIWAKFDGLLSEPQYHFALSSHELGGRDDIDLWYDGYSSQYIFTLGSDWATEFNVGVKMTSDDELHQWHHFVAVWDTTVGTKLYMDGVLRGSNGTTFNTLTALRWSIGGTPSAYKPWLGSLDEARAYNRVLTATEIWNLYQAGGGANLNSADSQGDALERGLSGYWKLDDGSGTTATDASTNGNNGTLTNGPTWTTGQIGGATTFDGSNDYITIPNSNDFAYNQDFSVSVWAKIPATQNDTAAADNSLIEKWSNVGGYPYMIRVNNQTNGTVPDRGKVGFARYDGTNAPGILSISALNDNSWHLITATKNGSTLALYVDGVRQSTTTDTTTGTTTNASPLCLGMRCSTAKYFTGSLDEVRIYNRGLSPSEVAKLYKTTAPDNPDSGLKGYWSFNGPDVSGTTVFDRSGGGNNGTSTGSPTVALGKIGQAFKFNGTSQYVKVADATSLRLSSGTYSISFWIKPNSTTGGTVLGKQVTGSFNGWSIGIGDNSGSGCLALSIGMAFENGWSCSSAVMTVDEWQHVILTYDGIYLRMYRNGSLFHTVGRSLPVSSTAALYIGNSFDSAGSPIGSYSPDSIDEVQIYNRQLSTTEIIRLYNLGR